jgi:hypothetical protein
MALAVSVCEDAFRRFTLTSCARSFISTELLVMSDIPAFEFRHRGATYQVYHCEWHPWTEHHLGYSGEGWELCRDRESLAYISQDEARHEDQAERWARQWLDAHAYECCGGPLDGDRLADYGEAFRVTFPREVRDGTHQVRIVPTEVRGQYRREGETYIWEPD